MVGAEQTFYRIPISDINPYSDLRLAGTVYLLGSPGSGKTKFMKRLDYETDGKFVLESGIFALFQKYVTEYVTRKRDAGFEGSITGFDTPEGRLDPDFRLPQIEGIDIWNCLYTSVPLDCTLDELGDFRWRTDVTGGKGQEAVCRNLPYSGWGAYHYREALGGRITSGGKSGYPDWLFIRGRDGSYTQIISFPGHHSLDEIRNNQSLPIIPFPSAVIYLVDPNIGVFNHEGFEEGSEYFNPALHNCVLHLKEALALESAGIKVQWYLSKTSLEKLAANRQKVVDIYGSPNRPYPEIDLSEIVRRALALSGFDSLVSSSQEIRAILKLALD